MKKERNEGKLEGNDMTDKKNLEENPTLFLKQNQIKRKYYSDLK